MNNELEKEVERRTELARAEAEVARLVQDRSIGQPVQYRMSQAEVDKVAKGIETNDEKIREKMRSRVLAEDREQRETNTKEKSRRTEQKSAEVEKSDSLKAPDRQPPGRQSFSQRFEQMAQGVGRKRGRGIGDD